MNKAKCLIVTLLMFSSTTVAEVKEAGTVIQLSAQQRALVQSEMRQFLSGLQQISAALSRDDMESVTRVARSLGITMSRHMTEDLRQALPQDFRQLGHRTHTNFDQIALDAESLGDSSHTLSQLSDTLSGCVSCHNTYRIQVIEQ